jgi:hypothetical protein
MTLARINDNDILLRGGSDTNHGIGWYGDVKPFGPSQPDGPVIYGYHGGVLGTTVGGPTASLGWDSSQVLVANDLNVGGQLNVFGNVAANTISADNVPAVNWDQAPYVGYTTQVVADVVLSTCSNARRASGFFVIMASAYVELHPNVLDQALFKLSLLDVTDPANPVTLTYTRTAPLPRQRLL